MLILTQLSVNKIAFYCVQRMVEVGFLSTKLVSSRIRDQLLVIQQVETPQNVQPFELFFTFLRMQAYLSTP